MKRDIILIVVPLLILSEYIHIICLEPDEERKNVDPVLNPSKFCSVQYFHGLGSASCYVPIPVVVIVDCVEHCVHITIFVTGIQEIYNARYSFQTLYPTILYIDSRAGHTLKFL